MPKSKKIEKVETVAGSTEEKEPSTSDSTSTRPKRGGKAGPEKSTESMEVAPEKGRSKKDPKMDEKKPESEMGDVSKPSNTRSLRSNGGVMAEKDAESKPEEASAKVKKAVPKKGAKGKNPSGEATESDSAADESPMQPAEEGDSEAKHLAGKVQNGKKAKPQEESEVANDELVEKPFAGADDGDNEGKAGKAQQRGKKKPQEEPEVKVAEDQKTATAKPGNKKAPKNGKNAKSDVTSDATFDVTPELDAISGISVTFEKTPDGEKILQFLAPNFDGENAEEVSRVGLTLPQWNALLAQAEIIDKYFAV